MLKLLRKFVILMLALALPTQGFAAAGMLACAPGHVRPMAALGIDAPVHQPVETVRHDHGAHQHAGQGAHGSHDQASQAYGDAQVAKFVDAVGGASALDDQSSTKCSACAACCFGAALLPGSVFPGAVDLALTPLHSLVLATVSFLTDGPIRPPRFLLA